MLTLLMNSEGTGRAQTWASLFATLLHVAALAFLVLVATKAPRVVPIHNPGSAAGKHLLLTYSTGASLSVDKVLVTRSAAAIAEQTVQQKAASVPLTTESKPTAEQGSGSVGLSGLGDGNMTIAALKAHPRPQPDLGTLSPGHGGNIILNAVIDAQGSISQLTVVQSLSVSIDR